MKDIGDYTRTVLISIVIAVSVCSVIRWICVVSGDHLKRQDDQNMACISAKGTVVYDQCIHPMLAE